MKSNRGSFDKLRTGRLRIERTSEDAGAGQNFGKLTIDWEALPVQLTYSIHAVGGGQRFSHTISLDEISF